MPQTCYMFIEKVIFVAGLYALLRCLGSGSTKEASNERTTAYPSQQIIIRLWIDLLQVRAADR